MTVITTILQVYAMVGLLMMVGVAIFADGKHWREGFEREGLRPMPTWMLTIFAIAISMALWPFILFIVFRNRLYPRLER